MTSAHSTSHSTHARVWQRRPQHCTAATKMGGSALGPTVAFRNKAMLQQAGHKREYLIHVDVEIPHRKSVILFEGIATQPTLQTQHRNLLRRDVLLRQKEHEITRRLNVVVYNGFASRHNSKLVCGVIWRGLNTF